MHAIRQASDLLPYLPRFRELFADLPNTVAQMKLVVTNVPLGDVECVTATVVKVDTPMWYLRIPKGTNLPL